MCIKEERIVQLVIMNTVRCHRRRVCIYKKKREKERETKERNLMMLLVGRQVKSNTFVTATIRNINMSFYCLFSLSFTLSSYSCEVMSYIYLVDQKKNH
jgi:hypothetical protein